MIADDPSLGAGEPPHPPIEAPDAVTVKQGRRKEDWVMRANAFNDALFEAERSIFFWLFGIFLDSQHKPSMSRLMLALWTYVGWQLMQHEMHLVVGTPAIQNAVWTAWWAAEGFLCVAVFAPSAMTNYFSAGSAGAVAASSISSAARDALVRRDAAKLVGSAGTEYTP